MTQPSRPSDSAPLQCLDGICDRLQIAEWDVETLKITRDEAVRPACAHAVPRGA